MLRRIEQARLTGSRFLLGCPTGRTPRPVFAAMARRLGESRQDLRHLVLVMMDEYLVAGNGALEYASAAHPWSCHHFARVEIAGRLNDALRPTHRIASESIWFPDPADPPAYDARIAGAGGIDLFILASGASDGHVAFNPPGSQRDSRTRIIELSDETRRDNLQTFPAFGTLPAVPHHGISVGIDTIASAREALMLVWGAGKGITLARMRRALQYEPEWPATVIHDCPAGEILADADALAGSELHWDATPGRPNLPLTIGLPFADKKHTLGTLTSRRPDAGRANAQGQPLQWSLPDDASFCLPPFLRFARGFRRRGL